MKPADFSQQPIPWLCEEGPDCEIVISSRVRLARNLAEYEFLPCLDAARKKEIIARLRESILAVHSDSPLHYIDVNAASVLERELLAERRLISFPLARGKGPRGVVIAEGETFTAMILEEDHLRMQAFAPGRQVETCYDRINRIDDEIAKKISFAFSARFGFLTACPTNLGTGIRVSVMLHLPALKLTGQIEKFLAAARDCAMAVRGLFGEGTEAVGDFYQLSNQVTLGISEREIVDNFCQTILPKIIDYERLARQKLLDEKPQAIEDKVQRALGVLRSARLVSSQEAMVLLSQVRLGIHLGRVNDIPLNIINDLFLRIQPAHLQIQAGKTLEPDQRDILRAQIIRDCLHTN